MIAEVETREICMEEVYFTKWYYLISNPRIVKIIIHAYIYMFVV